MFVITVMLLGPELTSGLKIGSHADLGLFIVWMMTIKTYLKHIK